MIRVIIVVIVEGMKHYHHSALLYILPSASSCSAFPLLSLLLFLSFFLSRFAFFHSFILSTSLSVYIIFFLVPLPLFTSFSQSFSCYGLLFFLSTVCLPLTFSSPSPSLSLPPHSLPPTHSLNFSPYSALVGINLLINAIELPCCGKNF